MGTAGVPCSFLWIVILSIVSLSRCLPEEQFFHELLLSELSGDAAAESRRDVQSCMNKLIDCRDTYLRAFIDFQTSYDAGLPIVVEEDTLNTTCGSSRPLESCLAEQRSTCGQDYNWKMSARYYSAVCDFICSEDGRRAFLETNGSQCDTRVNTDRLRSECQRRVQNIYKLERKIKTNRYKESGACSYIRDFRQCHIDAFSKACGEAVARFIYELDYLINAERYAYEEDPKRCYHI